MGRRWAVGAERCALCAAIGSFVEIDNPQDVAAKDVFDDLPAEVRLLAVPNRYLERYYRYKNNRLLQCPRCGTYYAYRTWAPGGSEDVLHTYVHESITRLTMDEVLALLEREVVASRERAEREPELYRGEATAAARGAAVERRRLAVNRKA